MKPKTKKILASCALSLPLLASSVLSPILAIKKSNADGVQDGYNGFHTQGSIFSYYGFDISFYPRILGVTAELSTPFIPFLPLGGDMQSVEYWQDFSYSSYTEDMPYVGSRNSYICSFDLPSYEIEGGIVDDEITHFSPQHSLYAGASLFTSGASIEPAFSIGFDEPRLIVLNEVLDALGQLEYKIYTAFPDTYSDILWGQLEYEILAFDEDGDTYWDTDTLNVDNLELSSFTHGIRPEAYPNTQGYNLVRNFKLVQYATSVPDVDDGSWWDMAIGYGLDSTDEFLFLTDFTRRNVDITDIMDIDVTVSPPPDIGSLVWQPVESFLNTEFLPDFTFGNMCMLALGLLLFGVFLKTFLGG